MILDSEFYAREMTKIDREISKLIRKREITYYKWVREYREEKRISKEGKE